jgi:hypothetical protein
LRQAIGVLVLLGLLGVLALVFPWFMFARLLAPLGYGRPIELRTAWHTENEWLMQTIGRDLVEMVAWASDPASFRTQPVQVQFRPATASAGAAPLSVPRVHLEARGSRWSLNTEVSTPTFVWSPADYEPTARALLAAARLGAVTSVPDPVLPELLLDLRAETLAMVDQRVSARLARGLLDPSAHEDAALVLGALACREAAGVFDDPRALLARMSAHLALARALRAPGVAGDSGRLAEALLLTLAGRGVEAGQALDALSTGSPAAQAWARALRARLSDDWRVPTGDTRLERLATFRALAFTLGASAAQTRLESWGLADEHVTDWGRLVLHAGPSVDDGWRFADEGLWQELDELRRVRAVMHLTGASEDAWPGLLEAPQERCVTAEGPRALGWGTWAAAAQRHIAARELAADVHHRRMLGLPDDADRRRAQNARQFGALRLQPLWALMQAYYSTATKRPVDTELWKRGPIAQPLALMTDQPEIVNARVWRTVVLGSTGGRAWRAAPPLERWFAGGVPFGTTYDAVARAPLPGAPDTAALLALAPDSYSVQFGEAQRLARLPPAARRARGQVLFARRTAYDGRALVFLRDAMGDDRAGRRRLGEQFCQLAPETCFELGDEALIDNDDAAAAWAFARACEGMRDRVMAAQGCNWYVAHLHDAAPEHAMELATELAETGAEGGLATLAAEHERRGEPAAAEAHWRRARERYDSDPPYLAFLYRVDVEQGLPAYRGRFGREASALFPAGLERARLHDFSGPPREGVVIVGESPYARRAGLRPADVIVALDGWRVRGVAQYEVLRELRLVPEMHFVVWRTPAYVEVHTRLSDHRFRADIRDVRP